MKDILVYRQKLQESIDDMTLKCIKSFEFYYDKHNNPHFSFNIIDSPEIDHLKDDKKKVECMIAELCPSEKHVGIDYDLSSSDFQPAMLSKQDDNSQTDDNPVDEKSEDEKDNVNVAATFTFKLGDKSISNPGSGSEGTCSRGLLIKLKRTPNTNLNVLKIIPDLDISKEIYAIVGASHTAPRILKLNQTSSLTLSSLQATFLRRPFVSDSDLIAHELNVAGQGFNVRKKFLHLYNDLEIFIIRNNKNSRQFEEFNSFDCTFIYWNGEIEKPLKGNIAQIWSGDVNNKVLEIGDEVYFIGQHNKSYGTVTAFPSKGVGSKEHSMIKCKLKVQKGDAGGVLFKPLQASHNKVECIAVGICSYFLPITGKNYGDISYFVPLTDLDQTIYELPFPFPLDSQQVREITGSQRVQRETVFDFQRVLLDNINDKTLKCIKSFEFYDDKDNKPHISFSIIDPSEEADLQEDKEKVTTLMLNAFGFTEDPVLIDYELSSDDFYPAMDAELVYEYNLNVAASKLAKLGNTSTCYLGSEYHGTCTRGLMIKLKLTPNNLICLENIIPSLDIDKEIYANVGASHTAPRIMNLEPIAHELNVAGHSSVNVRNENIHLYNDLEIFVIRNKMKSGSAIKFEELNTFNETFTDLNGQQETFKGEITHVWSGDVKNKVLEIGDEVYFIGQHNKSKGTVVYFPITPVGTVKHYMIKCKLKVQRGDSGGVLFKPFPESRDNNNKVKCIAVGICSYFLPIADKNYGDISYFVPLTDLDESIYELPESIDQLPVTTNS